MHRRGKSQKGFTLIELIIVVGILGILSAIAIPKFLAFQAKAKQSDAKMNLGAIFTAAVAFQSESLSQTFAPATIGLINFQPSGTPQYSFWYAVDATSGGPGPGTPTVFIGGATGTVVGCNVGIAPAVGATIAASPTGFTAGAIGNVDSDIACDEWTINDQRVLVNSKNDVSATS